MKRQSRIIRRVSLRVRVARISFKLVLYVLILISFSNYTTRVFKYDFILNIFIQILTLLWVRINVSRDNISTFRWWIFNTPFYSFRVKLRIENCSSIQILFSFINHQTFNVFSVISRFLFTLVLPRLKIAHIIFLYAWKEIRFFPCPKSRRLFF